MFSPFKNFKAIFEKKIGFLNEFLRSNGEGDYFSSELFNYLKTYRIQRQLLCRYAPLKNQVYKEKKAHC